MKKSELRNLIREVISEINSRYHKPTVYESAQNDIRYLESRLINEGIWSSIKQNVGGAINKAGGKAKELMIQPIINSVVAKLAKSDPRGFAMLKNAAQTGKVGDLLNRPEVQKQKAEIQGKITEIHESLYEENLDSIVEEYMEEVMNEAQRRLSNSKRNINRRKLYAKKKAEAAKLLKKKGMAVKDKKTGKKRRATQKDYEAIILALINKEKNDPKTPPEEKQDYAAILGALTQQSDGKPPAQEPQKPNQPTPPQAQNPNAPGQPTPPQAQNPNAPGQPTPPQAQNPNAPGQPTPPQAQNPNEPDNKKGFFAKIWQWIKDHPKISITIALGIIAAILAIVGMSNSSGDGVVKTAVENSGGGNAAADTAAATNAPTAAPTAPAAAPTAPVQQAQDMMAAKQAAAAQKADQAMDWLKNASQADMAKNSGLPELQKILGTVGNGAGQSYTRNAVRAYKMMGAGDEEGLKQYFTRLAMQASK